MSCLERERERERQVSDDDTLIGRYSPNSFLAKCGHVSCSHQMIRWDPCVVGLAGELRSRTDRNCWTRGKSMGSRGDRTKRSTPFPSLERSGDLFIRKSRECPRFGPIMVGEFPRCRAPRAGPELMSSRPSDDQTLRSPCRKRDSKFSLIPGEIGSVPKAVTVPPLTVDQDHSLFEFETSLSWKSCRPIDLDLNDMINFTLQMGCHHLTSFFIWADDVPTGCRADLRVVY